MWRNDKATQAMNTNSASARDVEGFNSVAKAPPLSLPPFRDRRATILNWLHQIYQCLLLTALALAAYFLISHFILQSVEIVGLSMSPTLHNADRYFVNRWTYHLRAPARGDVVVLKDPTDGKYSVKRIVALAGESIYIKNGCVYVNGEKLQEPYLNQGTMTYTSRKFQEELITCGKDRYYVLGDNRNNSFDSRVYGAIPRENILGVIMR
jgi:signal peptidase I